MGLDSRRFNREFFRNGAQPQDLIFRARGPVTDDQVAEFYSRLETRYTGAAKAHRPIVTGDGWEVDRLGINHRDMEWLAGLRWSLEGVAHSLRRAAAAAGRLQPRNAEPNVREARRMFWEKTIVPELTFMSSSRRPIDETGCPVSGTYARGLSVAFDLSTIEARSETETERTKRHVALVQAGILTREEARQERGLA